MGRCTRVLSLRKKRCRLGEMTVCESVPVGGLPEKRIINEVMSGGQWITALSRAVSKIPSAQHLPHPTLTLHTQANFPGPPVCLSISHHFAVAKARRTWKGHCLPVKWSEASSRTQGNRSHFGMSLTPHTPVPVIYAQRGLERMLLEGCYSGSMPGGVVLLK